jgi:precorrin-2 dehydrogenase/sirohydrochlorin ferrochelatase
LDIAGRRCVVIGGGQVATRKVASLLECGADVQVISPRLTPALEAASARAAVSVERRPYQPGDLRGAFVAIAATDSAAVNARVAAEAQATNVLVTVCDDPAASTITGMATVRRGQVSVSIGTNGESPALSRLVRDEIEHLLTPEYAVLLQLIAAERQAARGQSIPADRWRSAVTPDLLALVREGRDSEARERLRQTLGLPCASIEQRSGALAE